MLSRRRDLFYVKLVEIAMRKVFHEWNEWKKPQFNFSSQNISLERNFFKWDGKVTKIEHLLFHRIWKKLFPVKASNCQIRLCLIILWQIELSQSQYHTIFGLWYVSVSCPIFWQIFSSNFFFWKNLF